MAHLVFPPSKKNTSSTLPSALSKSGSLAVQANDEDEVASFAGAVGFFDAPESKKERHNSFDRGAKGFFDVLDERASTAYVYDANLTSGSRKVGWEELVRILSQNMEMKRIVVKNNGLRSSEMSVMSGTMMKFHNLRIIDFSGNPLGVRGLATLLDCCRSNIDLSELILSDVSLNDIAEQDFDVVCRALDDFPSLCTLNLSGNALPSDLVRAIAVSASEHPHLNRLYLERNSITPACAMEVLRLIANNVQLHTLYMTSSQQRSRGTTAARNPLSILQKAFRSGKVSLVDAFTSNVALRNIRLDSIATHDQARVNMILAQNENLWAQREGSRIGRASVASRGLRFVPPILFTLVHVTDLDLSHNAIEVVPKEFAQLKSLQVLLMDKNEITFATLPYALLDLRKLRQVTFAGNPFAADLPRDVSPDAWSQVSKWLTKTLETFDVIEAQCAVAVVGEVAGESTRIIAEMERCSKRQKVAPVRMVRGGIPQGFKASLAGKLIEPSTSKSILETAPRNASGSVSRRPGARNRLSMRGVQGLGNSLWAVLRDCDLSLLSVFSLFHRVVVFLVDMRVSDWEARLRNSLGSIVSGGASSNSHIMLAITDPGTTVLTPESRRTLQQQTVARFKLFGVDQAIILTQDADYQALFDALASIVIGAFDSVSSVRRSHLAQVASLLAQCPSRAPMLSVDTISDPNLLKAVQWAQIAGLLSAPLKTGVLCSSLEWALTAFDTLAEVNISVFQRDDLRMIFSPDAYSPASRAFALLFLESANAIIHTGWLRDQWIVQHQMLHAAHSSKPLLAFAASPPGTVFCSRLYRITSPLVEVSVASLIRKVFLQTAGVLSNISDVSENGFSGTIFFRDAEHAVQLSVERSGYLTISVFMHADPSGQVVHLVTTAIERGLEEERHQYERIFINHHGKDSKLDPEILNLINAKTRGELTKLMDDPKMAVTPDLRLLGSERIFWDEVKTEKIIGQGSFGEVSLASIPRPGGAVGERMKIALKNVKSSDTSNKAGDRGELREILRELWVLSVLRHPNIVGPAGVCLNPVAVCMDFMELGDLRAFLDRHTVLPWTVSHSLLMDIASGMEYAHRQRPPLLHSDLKSPNILLSAEQGTLVAKIADLGLASFSSFNTVTLVDNPIWSAPEMIQQDMCAPSVDVYSFAIIAWEILSCQFPFNEQLSALDNSFEKLRAAVVGGERPNVMLVTSSDIPADVMPLVQECWSDVSRRPSFRQILGRLAEMVFPARDDLRPPPPLTTVGGLRIYMPSPMATEPKTFCFLGGVAIVLSAQGMLWLYDSLTFTLLQTLRWKLAERVRSASAISFRKEAYFAFGSESIFIVNESLAARRVTGDLTCCDLLCIAGNAVFVAGRNASGVAIQIFRDGAFEGSSWNLPDPRCIIVALIQVSPESVWCVCSDKDGKSFVLSLPLTLSGSLQPAKSQLFDDRVTSAVVLPWDPSRILLCCAGGADAFCLDRDTLKVEGREPRAKGLHAPLAINIAGDDRSQSVLFGYTSKGGVLIGKDRVYSAFAAKETSSSYQQLEEVAGSRLVDASTALRVPEQPHLIIAWSKFGLRSWRIDTYGASPKSLIAAAGPCHSPAMKTRKKTAKSTFSKSQHRANFGKTHSSDSNKSTSSTSNSASNSAWTRSGLHLTRRAMDRATVTCDEKGIIISSNAGVQSMFGQRPDELVDKSVRTLFFVPRTRDRTGSVLLYSRQVQKRFSSTDLWKSLMQDLLKVRLVNGQCKDGSLVPLLISSSEILVGGRAIYVLLFEKIKKKCAIMVVDESGVISSASENLPDVIGWDSTRVQGKPITSVVLSPAPKLYMNARLFDPNQTFDGSAKTSQGQTVSLNFQVIDFSNRTYTIMFYLAGQKTDQDDLSLQLNHYSLGAVLGNGMCGEVRQGTHKLTNTDVAVKRIRKVDFDSAGVVFTGLEVDLMRGLDHPNVVQLYDCVRLENEMVLILELISGGELFQLCMDKGPLDEDESFSYFIDILSGVEYIHSKGIVHRDLKLENAILENGRVKIIDFGLGNFFTKGPLQTSCGSPNYAAPELFLSRRYAGPPIDLWAIGVMLFAMVTGTFPFDDIQDTVDGEYEWTGPVSGSLEDLIEGIFQVNADLRLTIPQIRSHPWVANFMNHGLGKAIPGLHDQEVIRTDVVARMDSEFGMPLEIVLKSLMDKEANHFTATYRLLRESALKMSEQPKPDQLQAVKSAMKRLEINELISLDAIKKRRQKRSGPKGLPRSLSGNLISSPRGHSRSRSVAVGTGSSESSTSPRGGQLLGSGIQQQAWKAAGDGKIPKRKHAPIPKYE